jgi:sucrose phosphorylase
MIAARAIQFFAPGVPQVYYVGMLAGENAPEEIERQGGERRAINRKNYTAAELEEALRKPVVQRLAALMRFRNEHPAFNGDFAVLDSEDDHLRLAWENGKDRAELDVDLTAPCATIRATDASGTVREYAP